MDTLLINRITTESIHDLQRIARQTFFETFSESNSEENMRKYLEETLSISTLSAELHHPHSYFYFVLVNDEIVGYLKLNIKDAQTDLGDANAVEIQRIYVLGKYHGKNIGQLLYEKALDVARELKASCIWLAVWEENPRAIRFYQKNGFVEFDKRIFTLGDDKQTDLMMKKVL